MRELKGKIVQIDLEKLMWMCFETQNFTQGIPISNIKITIKIQRPKDVSLNDLM